MLKKVLVASTIAAAIAGCGGSSSSGNPPASLALSGTAMNGAAIAAAPISIKCQAGTGTATTKTDGTYSVAISGASLPCALELTNPADNTKLHSVAIGSGTSATSNITPLTELTVANLQKQVPATAFTSFDAASAAGTLTSDAVKNAQSVVLSFLAANSVNATALANTDVISAPLASGDAQSSVLASVQKTITVPIADVSSILATAPASCPVAKSGKYTVISYTGTVSSYNVDFAAKTIVLPGDTKPTAFAASSTNPCEFTGGDVTVNFAKSGLAIYKATTAADMGIAFPVQTFDKSAFGNTYNVAGYFANGNGFAAPAGTAPNAQTGTMKINADGSYRVCGEGDYSDQCTLLGNAITGKVSATLNADGTANFVNADGSASKFYSYTAPSGEKLLALGEDKTFMIAAKQASIDSSTIALNSTSVFYSIRGYAGVGTGAQLTFGTNTVTAVTAAQLTNLQHTEDGVTPDDTNIFLLNNPWAGMRHRDADAAANKSARNGMSTRLGFSTNGSVNKVSSTGITAAGTGIFSLSIAR